MPDVLVSEKIVGEPLDALREQFDVSVEPQLWQEPGRLAESIAGVRALVVRNQTQVTAELIARAGRLEIIARAGAGLDNVDVEAATRAGIVVVSTPSQNSLSVAELTLGLMLSLARGISAADRHVKEGGWDRLRFVGSELYAKTLGVLGFGRIGYLTACRAAAFGMDVIACDPYIDPDSVSVVETRARLASFDRLLAEADFVTCHLPGGASTRRILGYAEFCLMKPSAFFINVARGEVVDEAGLVRALEEKRIAGAALDVRAVEPPRTGRLEQMENVIFTPHVAAFTHEAQHRVVASVCRDVRTVLTGGEARNFFNFSKPRRPA